MKYGRPAAAYALAVLAVAGTALLRWLLGHWLDESAPMLLFVLPIALSACLGGLGPGLLATLLSVVAGSMLFLHQTGTLLPFSVADRLRLILFVLTGILLSGLYQALLSGQRRLKEQRGRLEEEIAARRVAESSAAAEGHGLELALGLAGMGSWEWNVTSGMVTWSESAFLLLGYAAPPPESREVPFARWADMVQEMILCGKLQNAGK